MCIEFKENCFEGYKHRINSRRGLNLCLGKKKAWGNDQHYLNYFSYHGQYLTNVTFLSIGLHNTDDL